ncbi:hypothetical protein TNCV_4833331 [Trichonephila clavipes]|nr:hypothetical protein TNCV_4833331 [Trichonephila clavipes]
MATGSYMTPTYSRSQSEVQGDLHMVTIILEDTDKVIVVRKPVIGPLRVTTYTEDRYIAVVTKRNRGSVLTRVAFMVAAVVGKTISATTVRRKLHLNGL